MERVGVQDEKWEFDAPKFMDFERLGSPGMEDVHVDAWFDTSATKGLASPESGSGEDPAQPQLQGEGGHKDQGKFGIEKENRSLASGLGGAGLTKQTGVEGKQQVRAVLAHICGNTTPITRQMAKKVALSSLQSGGGCPPSRHDLANNSLGVAGVKDPVKKRACISIYEPVAHDSRAKVVKKENNSGEKIENKVTNLMLSSSVRQKPVTRSQVQLPTPPGTGQGQNLVATPVPADVKCSEKETKWEDVVKTDKLKGKRVKEGQQKPWTNKLTVPRSPMLRSKQRCNSQKGKHIKSSEELEIEEIEKKRKEAQKLRKKSQRYIEASLRGSSRLAPKPAAGTAAGTGNKRRPLTVPREPKLRTSKRQRTATAATATVPNLITSRGSGFTMGSRNKAAEASQREKRQREQAARRGPVTRSQAKPRLTRPKTPNFATNRRARAPRYKPSEEIELEQIAQYKPFHPRPITRSMGEHKPKQVVKAKKELTVPQPFSFATDKRATRKPPAISNDPPMFVFGAEGPVTRSRAKQTTTSRPALKGSTKETKSCLSRDSDTSFASESTNPSVDKISAPKLSVGGASLGRARGSLLRGGAVRVLQPATVATEVEEPAAVEKEETTVCGDADPDLFQDLVDGVHDFIKVQGHGADKTNVHNPLFRM
eukprot:jgi/Picsp_1/206/NSC_00205-R1_hypothetical protein CHLNCDRAFT_50139 [Chlorella variabilis]